MHDGSGKNGRMSAADSDGTQAARPSDTKPEAEAKVAQSPEGLARSKGG
jgi:hypothetical protein